jgi:hypothetical protein
LKRRGLTGQQGPLKVLLHRRTPRMRLLPFWIRRCKNRSLTQALLRSL